MTSFSSTPLPPRVCIFAVESGSATTLFSPQHSLFAAQNALYAFADFLALYDYSTLVSLLTFGHTLTVRLFTTAPPARCGVPSWRRKVL